MLIASENFDKMKPTDINKELVVSSRPYFPPGILSLIYLFQSVCLLLQIQLPWPFYLEHARAWASYIGMYQCLVYVFVFVVVTAAFFVRSIASV